MSKQINVVGARENNLKNISVNFPKNKFIVVTGVSGSGKSSLVIDTLFAEGQRRYVESLSSYARQFLLRMDKPDVDYIKGLCPAIAIEQQVSGGNSRSTVGSLTEIYDYLKLLFARVGKTYSPISGELVKKDEVQDVMEKLLKLSEGEKIFILSPIEKTKKNDLMEKLEILLMQGFTRIKLDEDVIKIEDAISNKATYKDSAFVLIDRLVMSKDDDLRNRLTDSIQSAFNASDGYCSVEVVGKTTYSFSNKFEADGMVFEEPRPQMFSFNNSYGACPTCEGFGKVVGIDKNKVMPDRSLSVYEGAIAPWKGIKMSRWQKKFLDVAMKFDFPIHRGIEDLTEDQEKLLWTGNKHFKGLDAFFKELESNLYKIQYRVMLSKYRGKTLCGDCEGSRLRKDALYVRVENYTINDFMNLPIEKLYTVFQELELKGQDEKIAGRLLIEVKRRLNYLNEVGLGYLQLSRRSSTLSGGETQRINLTRSLGSNLTGSLYILDEPSIGLHSRDTLRLIKVLEGLRDLGNTVVVVEHDEDMMRAADHIIDMGPLAGIHGGEEVASGNYSQIINNAESLTGKYLKRELEVTKPDRRRTSVNQIRFDDIFENNISNGQASIPLNTITVVSGVSGSGKSTLVNSVMHEALKSHYAGALQDGLAKNCKISGSLDLIHQVDYIDQNPIGRSPRSNPATYIKAYDSIRDLFANQKLAQARGYKAKHFSFNVDGGRCDNCKGEGITHVEMQFLADVHLMCEECNGMKFKPEVREIKYKNKSISEVLELSITESLTFFKDELDIIQRLKCLEDVGLGYIKLGQPSNTLSGGEAQRVKLASYLTKGATTKPVLFLFDEPTTGLHFHDIEKLLTSFNALIEKGHTVVVIEHNLDVIKAADHVIELGPDAGERGGEIIFTGNPEALCLESDSITGALLKPKLLPSLN